MFEVSFLESANRSSAIQSSLLFSCHVLAAVVVFVVVGGGDDGGATTPTSAAYYGKKYLGKR